MSAQCQQQTNALQQTSALFDHLVGEREQLGRYGDAKRFGCLEVYRQHVINRLLKRQVGDLSALQNSVETTALRDPP
jgi:hypothetical protein